MGKTVIVLSTILIALVLIECSTKPDASTETKPDSVTSEEANLKDALAKDESTTNANEPAGSHGNLTIHGKDIWIRDSPRTGKVIMKLNEGDVCKEMGNEEFRFPDIIRGKADIWMEIEFNGKPGWVFGSQTSSGGFIKTEQFSSLDEVVKKFEFDSSKLPDSIEWSGDSQVTEKKLTVEENSFASVSFFYYQTGMSSRNFSWLGFQENAKWNLFELDGEIVKLIHKKNKLLALMYVKSTGGAFTFSADYLLFLVEPSNKNYIRQQIIFEFAKEFKPEMSFGKLFRGDAKIEFLDEEGNQFQITETIDHDYDKMRKGTWVTTFQFNEKFMMYEKMDNP